ncbi:AI-2E family transporter [Dongia soli]|uniref:AI-2E family transporter n=1 Tax=Dongia soli TaxID=600628 RepID=A0ABU5EDZ3_9PROT|nr:AI-2E family transporter [Dongia soli]MDY0884575.1 AI-2E family transporter [Dongia soli]
MSVPSKSPAPAKPASSPKSVSPRRNSPGNGEEGTSAGGASAADTPATITFPEDFRLIVQLGLLILALLAAMYVAAEVILPIVLAFVLKLLLQPAMRGFERLHVPRPLAALLVLSVFFGAILGVGTALSTPGAAWLEHLPQAVSKLEERLSYLREPLGAMRNFLRRAEELTQVGPADPSPVVSPSLAGSSENLSVGAAAVPPPAPPAPAPSAMSSESGALLHQIFMGTWSFAAGFATTILMLFFLLISGDTFLRRLVEILPSFSNKRQVVDISQQIERDISIYLMTITIMNALVGTATGLMMWTFGTGDPILWGAVAFLLNYIPVIGPLFGVGLFLLVGLLGINTVWQAILPAACYLMIHLIEGQIVTPLILARRFTLNPVLVIMTLVFWFWMWGVVGAVLSIPMLAIAKIICDRIRPLAALGHFLSG